MTETAIVEVEALKRQSEDILAQASQVTAIQNSEQYKIAADRALMLNSFIQGMMEYWKPLKDAAYKSHKQLCARETEMLAPVVAVAGRLDRLISEYLAEQKRIQAELQRKAEEAARKQQEDEALKEAIFLEQSGDKASAERVITDALTAPVTATVASSVPKVAGIAERTTWTFAITDKALLLKAVLEGKVPQEAVMIDPVFVGQMVRAMKRKMNWPGVKVIEVSGVAKRRI